ncbi:MAG: hypothetical protein ACOCQQ_00165 [Candidatus Nanoarchaeia archaeon]
MCEFHLNDQCFNPTLLPKGIVAKQCSFIDCSHCTNRAWQENKIAKEMDIFKEIQPYANKLETQANMMALQAVTLLHK